MWVKANADMRGIVAGFGAGIQKINELGAIGEVTGPAQAHPGRSYLVVDREPLGIHGTDVRLTRGCDPTAASGTA